MKDLIKSRGKDFFKGEKKTKEDEEEKRSRSILRSERKAAAECKRRMHWLPTRASWVCDWLPIT